MLKINYFHLNLIALSLNSLYLCFFLRTFFLLNFVGILILAGLGSGILWSIIKINS